ncbi:hypothetical protein [Shewanella sp. YIC-542]|uniref:hypothetical protein n=1 Tax=Shewanella mytili TaxID=3377111 RepID=UPI00398F63FF
MQLLRRHMGLILTLLAFVGQGLLSNDHWMIPPAKATPEIMVATTSQHDMTAAMDCHPQTTLPPCCDEHNVENVLPNATTAHHCCDDKGFCKGGHCLVISVTGSLLTAVSWPVTKLPDVAVATPMPHFRSIDVNPNFKPPIA